jgi:hypothetical protein
VTGAAGESRVEPITLEQLDAQEAMFGRAFASANLALARPLYHRDVVYVSPTVRLFGWPALVRGVDDTLRFIGLTITGLDNITYHVAERAVVPDGGAYVKVEFDFDIDGRRRRSTYVVVYRYSHTAIARQEIYYDPSAEPPLLTDGAS